MEDYVIAHLCLSAVFYLEHGVSLIRCANALMERRFISIFTAIVQVRKVHI